MNGCVKGLSQQFADKARALDVCFYEEDVGIGHYEYWGAKGYDSCIAVLVEDDQEGSWKFEWYRRTPPSVVVATACAPLTLIHTEHNKEFPYEVEGELKSLTITALDNTGCRPSEKVFRYNATVDWIVRDAE
jgi:hypothetical protein